MNYLWEAMLQLKKQGAEPYEVRFQMAKIYSAYMEIANDFLNEEHLEDNGMIEVNPYYRFFDIFKDLYVPEPNEMNGLKAGVTNVILHQLAENDCLSGMTKEHYYKKLLCEDFSENRYGREMKELFGLFSEKEKKLY